MQINTQTFDRRTTSRQSLEAVSFYCWRNGRRIALPVIERSNSGARVILPSSLAHESELLLVYRLGDREYRAEYGVAWRKELVGGKFIAGLQCMLSTKAMAA